MAAISEEELSEEFDMFGIDLGEDELVLKLKELCALYRLSATDIANEWIAFSQTKKGVELNQESLDQFDREKLSKKQNKTPKTPLTKKSKPVIYDINTIHKTLDNVNDEDEAQKLYNSYGTPTSKGSMSKKRQHTPDSGPVKRLTGVDRVSSVPFSPASFSPASATPSRKYASRTNRGDVLMSYPNDNIIWKPHQQHCNISYYDNTTTLTSQFKYMFQKLTDKAHVLNDIIEDMASQIQQHNNIEELSHVALPTQEAVTICGRVCCDSIGKLNKKSVVLEGSRDTSAGRVIPLELNFLSEYSLFPGQIVAVDGLNSSGQKFIAQNLHQNVSLPFPVSKIEGDMNINIMLAAGPFTTSDTLTYEPLADFLQLLQKDKPNVLVLMGPLVDSKNTEIEVRNTDFSFKDIFRKQMDDIVNVTEKLSCELIILPSYRDVHHDYVYPQPPYIYNTSKSHVHLMSDPCTININNMIIGMTSTDILFHLGQEEISQSVAGSKDRLGRLAQHLLLQQSYYPLYPPNEDINIDYDHYEDYGRMPVTPHILLLPSDLRYFIKDINGCCVVNPGRLAKGQVGGTFSKLMVKTTEVHTSGSLLPSISAQILKI
ncbi:hypothetical protein LOTGIDRAFT_110777 [Lottia gigantea]|uniref:DNA polymerase alpha subunit B n=1 Tax=Lottia gigantea TaxID=225164 RepID=V4BAC9_LOTGI|nr:hypothetical protein LOTGIDRAFT_110777 [Lottia gigantea]ESP02897.1 hypothetical protein LOTGIDRAFT_110777 [Lottia gigantea]